MTGKIVKIAGNDLYGNVDEREIAIFACFEHTKYMNKYIIFTFKDEYTKKILYFGSVHFKMDVVVSFRIDDNNKQYIEQFLTEFMSNNLIDFKLVSLDSINKIQLVSYNNMDFEYLDTLDTMTVAHTQDQNENVKNGSNSALLYILLIILIGFLGFTTYLYFFPEAFTVKNKMLTCTFEGVTEGTSLNYITEREIKFDKNNKITIIAVTETYSFSNQEEYDDFKINNKHEEFFEIKDKYEYLDDELQLKLFYNDKSIIDNYDEMFDYLKKEKYICTEGTYEE